MCSRQMVELIKAQGLPAGVGGHSLNMPIECEKHEVNPDFYVKTLHMDRYWSATPKARRKEYDWMGSDSSDHDANDDNMWCNNPEETIAFMETVGEALGGVQGDGGRGDSAADGVLLRLPPRRRFRYRGDVRFSGRERRQDRH